MASLTDDVRVDVTDLHRHEFASRDWPFDDPMNAGALTSVHVVEGTLPICVVTHDADGTWQVLCGTTNDSGDGRLACLGCLFERDPSIGVLADLPRGWRAWRESVDDPWHRERDARDDATDGETGDDGCRHEGAEPDEEKALSDIETYGCHVVHVRAEDERPPSSYSVGIQRSSGVPEIIVIGLERSLAHFSVNEYNERVRSGKRFAPGQVVSGFIDGFDCQCRAVHRSHYDAYLGWDLWLYRGADFEVLQLVYPTTSGVWPWDPEADAAFRAWQPLLEDARDDGTR